MKHEDMIILFILHKSAHLQCCDVVGDGGEFDTTNRCRYFKNR